MTSFDPVVVSAFVGAVVLLKLVLVLLHGIYAAFFRAGKDLTRYGKWAVVTGATDGIGKAFAVELAKRKLNLVLISRTQSKLDEVKKFIEEKYSVKVETVAVDFSKLDDAAKKRVQDTLGGDKDLGLLINNVGQSYEHPQYFTELDNQTVDDLLALNVDSVVFMTRTVLPAMENKKRGAIVNISSASGRFASPLLTHYSATKSFVELFSRGLAVEVAGKGIHVQVQSPLYVTTKLAKKRHATWDTPSPEAYAKAAVRFIGYENACSPWWAHALILWVITHTPESVASRVVNSMHHTIRKLALKKKASKQN